MMVMVVVMVVHQVLHYIPFGDDPMLFSAIHW